MQWLVCIGTDGILQQYKLSEDISKSAKKEKSLENQSKIIFTFDKEINFKDLIKMRYRAFLKDIKVEPNMQGYNMRRSTFTDYIEVLVDIDSKNYNDFKKDFHGLQGAIDLLLHTIKVMRPSGGSASKIQWNWIEKLQLEIKQKEQI